MAKCSFCGAQLPKDEDGNDIVEYLMTNLPKDLFDTDDLKECYWRRWQIESSYGRSKNRMKLEEFSGYKPELILQDFYADMWVYNLVSLKIIYANEHKPVEQGNGKYIIKRNFNKAVGTLKHLLLNALVSDTEEERNKALEIISMNIESNLTWIKDEDRQFERKTAVNKSKISYRKTY